MSGQTAVPSGLVPDPGAGGGEDAGVDLVAAVPHDEMLRPRVTLRTGGTAGRMVDDTVVWPAPLTDVDARALLAGLRSAPLLGGVEGRSHADAAAGGGAPASRRRPR